MRFPRLGIASPSMGLSINFSLGAKSLIVTPVNCQVIRVIYPIVYSFTNSISQILNLRFEQQFKEDIILCIGSIRKFAARATSPPEFAKCCIIYRKASVL